MTESKTNSGGQPSSYSPIRDDYYHRMIEEVEDYAILMINREGFIISWNKGAEKIKGYSAQEIISKNFRIFYTPEDQRDKLPEKLLDLGARTGKAHHEGWRVRKDGSKFWGSIVITAIHDDDGQVIGFTKVTRDLTERKLADDQAKAQARKLSKVNQDLLITQQQLEDKIEQLDRANKDLEQFAYIASHDLQEPLRKINAYFAMFCQILGDKIEPRAKHFRDKIISSTDRMRSLIKDLLTLSTISGDIELVPVDLNKVMEQAMEGLDIRIQEKKAMIDIGRLPVVAGIESYLVQLFLNLLSNALKFSTNSPVIRITAETKNEKAVVIIRDNGIGIEQKYLHQIFDAFKRLHPRHKYEGTGIGLAICKKITDTLGGKMEVESELGKGTTFRIILNPA